MLLFELIYCGKAQSIVVKCTAAIFFGIVNSHAEGFEIVAGHNWVCMEQYICSNVISGMEMILWSRAFRVFIHIAPVGRFVLEKYLIDQALGINCPRP